MTVSGISLKMLQVWNSLETFYRCVGVDNIPTFQISVQLDDGGIL